MNRIYAQSLLTKANAGHVFILPQEKDNELRFTYDDIGYILNLKGVVVESVIKIVAYNAIARLLTGQIRRMELIDKGSKLVIRTDDKIVGEFINSWHIPQEGQTVYIDARAYKVLEVIYNYDGKSILLNTKQLSHYESRNKN